MLLILQKYATIILVIKMKIKANAKINLTLDVVRRRSDGYHDVEMIMQTLALCDEIEINKTEKGILLSGSGAGLAYDESNLAYRAAQLFFDKCKIDGGAQIYIEKKIPICAGLAGGSSDAAAVLTGLNELFGMPLTKGELMETGAKLGADVPFCIMKGTALAQGIGEILSPIAPIDDVNVVLVKPDIGVSTPWAYKNLELEKIGHPDTEKAVRCIESGDTGTLWKTCANVFESVVFTHYPIVKEIKESMASCGADLSLMSGSGPTVFGIFENENNAKAAYKFFKEKFKETFLTKNYNV